MRGFKSGASDDDPLGGSEDDSQDSQPDSTVDDYESVGDDQPVDDEPLSDNTGSNDSVRRERGTRSTSSDSDGTSDSVGIGDGVPTPKDGQLPWLFARDSITDGRERTVQLHLQTATVDRQRRARSALEDRVGDRVSKADLREAALLIGLADLDEVAAVLETWGYGAE